ncbi:hypothetical protein [Kutzneria buriramensis]|uniref:MmyB-like transcription regulator ligand binding domain-containing protein n=1 Tax=Kutzneria buriramensis TaxID=1045776 RepID=A0A3E0HYZ4_9PSEU|nr:hypothetical protein [Kutzneria buriramensis]REH51601.1 hypothetical protein BCF44_10350 [Kutzneria buriramensis]
MLATNRNARLAFADSPAMRARDRIVIRWLLFDPAARALHDDRAGIVEEAIGMLRELNFHVVQGANGQHLFTFVPGTGTAEALDGLLLSPGRPADRSR